MDRAETTAGREGDVPERDLPYRGPNRDVPLPTRRNHNTIQARWRNHPHTGHAALTHPAGTGPARQPSRARTSTDRAETTADREGDVPERDLPYRGPNRDVPLPTRRNRSTIYARWRNHLSASSSW